MLKTRALHSQPKFKTHCEAVYDQSEKCELPHPSFRTALAMCPVFLWLRKSYWVTMLTLSLAHTHTHTLPESTLKLGLLEVCIWDCALSLVVKWSAHANRPIMYILLWHGAILKLEHCISAVVF